VHVAVRIHPEQADRQLLRRASPFGGRRDRSRAETVIAAEDNWHRPLVERSQRGLVELQADLRDIADVLLVLVAQLLCFGNWRGQVPFVDDRIAQCGELLAKAGDAEGGRSHVDAAPAAAEVEGDTDDVHGLHKVKTQKLKGKSERTEVDKQG